MDESKFNNLQHHYLRLGLNTYKVSNNLTWLRLAEEIICSHTNEYDFPEDDAELESLRDEDTSEIRKKDDAGWPLQYQDLRRFVDGVPDKKSGERKLKKLSYEKLIVIRDFLAESGFLAKGFHVDDERASSIAISTIMDYFQIAPEALNTHKIPNLTGYYESEHKDADTLVRLRLNIINSSEEMAYKIEEFAVYLEEKSTTVIKEEFTSGLIFTPTNDSAVAFLKQELSNSLPHKNRKLYLVNSIERNKTLVLKINVEDISSSLVMTTKLEDKEKTSRINYSFTNSAYIVKEALQRKSNVVNLFDKKNPEISGFGSGQAAAHSWVEYQQKIKAQKGDRKGSGLSKEDLNKAFLDAVQEGKYRQVRSHLDEGADINTETEYGSSRALHLAAYYNAVPTIKELIKESDMEYLVLDSENRLPSFYAMMVAKNPALTRFLMQKEKAEAEAQGLDYEKIATLCLET